MRVVAVLLAATVVLPAFAAVGQGFFILNNRSIPNGVNARFILDTDPPGTSSVGTNFQAQVFGGRLGTPVDQLVPLQPPSTTFRGPAGSITAGFINQVRPSVPDAPIGTEATVLLRVFDGASWDGATYQFQGVYTVYLTYELPEYLPLGTSPLVLIPVPEPPVLALLAAVTVTAYGLRQARTRQESCRNSALGCNQQINGTAVQWTNANAGQCFRS